MLPAPARKAAIVAGLRHLGLPPHRDRRSLDDHLPTLARPGGLRALQAAQRRSLRPAPTRGEAHLVCDIGDGIAVRVDLDLVEPLGREGLVGSRSRLDHVEGRVHVHNEDRLAGISRLGESKQIGVVEAGVPTGKR